ncbi:unnamed protein product [Linum trigynum]|uniref:Uncharacterized protein n=1 Tax=Linum trigynum TaxID=586398 RepID=A0AAV2D4C9_9ROSI
MALTLSPLSLHLHTAFSRRFLSLEKHYKRLLLVRSGSNGNLVLGKDKHVMRGWKTEYQSDSNGRRVLREQLSSYWRQEGSLGEEDAVDFRNKRDPVAWWETLVLSSYTPDLQTLAIRALSQVCSVGMC